MSVQVRPYQARALDKIYADLQVKQNVLLVGMMGCGKTFISVRLVNRLVKETPGLRVLILMHKQELCQQFANTFQKFSDIHFRHIGICCASLKTKTIDRQITIASIQTFVNMKEKYLGAGLIIIDEAHRIDISSDTQYRQVIDHLRLQRPNCRIFGITATPARLGHGYIYGSRCKPGNQNLFDNVSYKITYEDLREEGFLVPLKGVVAAADSLERDLAGVSVNGDYVLDQLGEIMAKEIHLDTAREAIEKHCGGYKRICVFCCTIDHAEKLHAVLGSRATLVHSQLSPLERQINMEAWRSGKTPIMCSINILVEGFDMPALDCLVFARPTMSSTLFLQAVGRVLRICEGKDHGFLVDLTDNTARFGTDLDNVKVTIPKAVEKVIEKEQELYKLCPNCESEVLKARRECPECGFQWPETECVVAAALPKMQAVTFGYEEQEPVLFDVVDCEIDVHTSQKNGKFLGKVTYYYRETAYKRGAVFLWLCFPDFYSGFAVERSREKWEQISPSSFPESVEQFMGSNFFKPEHISVIQNGKYPELVEVFVSEETVFDDEVPF